MIQNGGVNDQTHVILPVDVAVFIIITASIGGIWWLMILSIWGNCMKLFFGQENMGEVVNHDGLASNVAVFELEKTHHQIAQIWI